MIEKILQLSLNGLMAGAVLAVPAIGLTMIYAVLRFVNFSVAAHMAVGAFAGYMLNVWLGLPAWIAIFGAFIGAAAFGIASDHVGLRPLRGQSALTLAIASIAVNLMIESTIRFFLAGARAITDPVAARLAFRLSACGTAAGGKRHHRGGRDGAVVSLPQFTFTGKAMRAVADNPMLADCKGIDPDRMARLAIGIGMGLAGIGGMLVGLDTSIDPLVGFRAILSVFAAAVVGGLGSVPGAVVGGLAIGLAEELSLLVLAPTYKGVVGFLAILVILLLRPGGILGGTRSMTNYLIAMATFASIYAILALGLNVMWGMAGMVNLGIVGFYGFGAYISALLTVKGHAPIAVGFAAAMIGTAIMGALVTLGLTRLRDDYLAIVTLGFAEAMRIVAENEIWLTKGTDGISGIPQPLKSVLGPDFNAAYLVFCLVVLAIVLFVLERVRSSPFGRVLRAIREDAQVAAFAGKDVLKFKVKAFAIGGALAGLAGALYAHYSSYIVPEIYVPLLTIYIFLALTAGGIGNNWGAVIGAFVVVFFLESTRFLIGVVPWLSAEQLAALREFLVGLLLLLVLFLRPRGLLPEPLPKLARVKLSSPARSPRRSSASPRRHRPTRAP